MNLKEMECEGVDWVIVAQSRDKLRSVVNMAVILGLQEIRGIYCPTKDLLASEEELWHTELVLHGRKSL
jgi:hypothetical protein